jgi:Mn2+/Fe2+ NRAMP family transporter
MHYNMTTRAKAKGIEDTITLEALRAVALRSAGKCEVSGVAFYMGHLTRHPFQASIDRIDSSRGYEITNVRFVCLSVNMCMAQWGASVFHTIAAATVAKRLRDLSKDGEEWARNGENNFPEESPIVVTT